MNLPGTLGQAQDFATLEYPDIKQNELSEDEADNFVAIPAFMEGTNVSINFPFQANLAKFVYNFRKCRMGDDLALQAKVRTLRSTEFGEIVHPFTNGDWDQSYYGPDKLTDDFTERFSTWLGNSGINTW